MTTTASLLGYLFDLTVIGALICICVIDWHERRTALPNAQPTGIGGWLAVLALVLSLALVLNTAEVASLIAEFSTVSLRSDAYAQITIILVMMASYLLLNAWVAIALLRRLRGFRRAFFTLWIMSAIAPLSPALLTTVPGITPGMIFKPELLAQSAIGAAVNGAWYWYLRKSVRVKNTFGY